MQSDRYKERIEKIKVHILKLEEDIQNVKNKETIKALEYCIALKKSNMKMYEKFERTATNGLETI